MLCRTSLLLTASLLILAGCATNGQGKNPFAKEKPFVATAVPVDFAIIVDENHDTYYARQHIRQEISVADAMSKTTYTTMRDFNNTVSNQFSQETPLSPVQLQNMWNDIARYNLLTGSRLFINWLSDADLYKRNSYTIQIRANGQSRTYRATNGFAGSLRPLMLQIEAVRLPITQDSTTHVVGRPSATPEPETMPSLAPSTNSTTTNPAPTIDLSPALDSNAVTPTTIPSMQPNTQPAQ